MAAGAVTPASADAGPQRIVSINMCTDELLLRLADRERIASVTWLSQDPRNANMAALAATVPANHGLAEEVAAAHPDLVLAGAFTTRTTIALLKRLGIDVVEFGVPTSLHTMRAEIRALATAVHEPARGEALVAEIDARLARLAQRLRERPRLAAIVLRPNGFTAGRGSLVDEILTRAGLDNRAAALGYESFLQVPLEAVALQKVDVLILDGESRGLPSLATQTLHHPIVRALAGRVRIVSLPSRLWTCAGPSVVEAIERLVDATRSAPQGAAPPSAPR